MIAPSYPKALATSYELHTLEVGEFESLDTNISLAVTEIDKDYDIDDSAVSFPSEVNSKLDQVEEMERQSYATSNELDEMINESPKIMLEDLAIDSLDFEDKESLCIEQAQELIPQEALKSLKEKFNGHLENCRPIQDFDRLI